MSLWPKISCSSFRFRLVVVTHSTGHGKLGVQFFNQKMKAEIEGLGGTVFTGTDSFTGYEIAMGKRGWFSPQALIATVLRMFGQGMKVCVEIVAVAEDAGLIPVQIWSSITCYHACWHLRKHVIATIVELPFSGSTYGFTRPSHRSARIPPGA
jgi:hypothetical protein